MLNFEGSTEPGTSILIKESKLESIKHLNLTPAESYFIQDPDLKDGKTMMKYSLIHLIYKKMLSTEVTEEETGIFKKKMTEATYVDRAERFTTQGLKPHESIICSVINFSEKMKLRTLVEKIYEKYNFNNYVKLIQEQLLQDGILEQKDKKFLFFKYKRPGLSEKGLEVQKKIKDILKTGKDNLEDWVKNDPPKAKSYMEACGANLFILSGMSPAMLQTWNRDLRDAGRSSDSSFMYWGEGGGSDLNDVENIDSLVNDLDGMNSFDSMESFDSFDAGFDGVGDAGGGGCGGGGCGGGGCGGG